MGAPVLPNGLKCRLCWGELVGRQRRYCSARCGNIASSRDARDRAYRTERSVEEEPMRVLEGEDFLAIEGASFGVR